MRLGASLEAASQDPAEIARAYAEAGYSAAVCPPVTLDQPERIRAIREAFDRHDVMLAEVGAWNNMLDPNPQRRAANVEATARALTLADEVGAVCCVNIAGSFDPENWMGPHPNNLSEEAFALTVENARRVIDAARPGRAYFTIETMPWVIPDSADSYLALLEAVDRPAFRVHFDPVNLINSPWRYYDNAAYLRECFAKLGPWIVSCHAKDVVLHDTLTLFLEEVRPGLGGLDYAVLLQETSRLPGDVPLLLEHLPQAEYPAARDYVAAMATRVGVALYEPKEET